MSIQAELPQFTAVPTTTESTDARETPSQQTNAPETPTTTTPAQQQQQQHTKMKPPNDTNIADEKGSLETSEDYQAVTKALHVLQHQLKQATRDIQILTALKKEAMARPFEFVADLKSKKISKRVPRLQRIVTVPEIDWSKYRFLPETRLAQQAAAVSSLAARYSGQSKRTTFRNILDSSLLATPESAPPTPVAVKSLQRELAKASQAIGQVPSRAPSVSDFSDRESEDESEQMVGGKSLAKRRTSTAQTGTESRNGLTPDNNNNNSNNNSNNNNGSSQWSSTPSERSATPRFRPLEPRLSEEPDHAQDGQTPTHNQPWTDEEQRRLEELLEIYPDEPVQAQRFNKISKALGTRTARQVASRVQKYFIKLAKLGLPVPGRITIPPSCLSKSSQGGGIGSAKPKGRSNGKVGKPKMKTGVSAGNRPKSSMRTSGVGYNVMVSGGITNTRISGAHYLTTHASPSLLMSEDEEDEDVKEMMLKVAKPTAKKMDIASGLDGIASDEGAGEAVHEGYACDGCGCEPIVGVRYKCTVCDISEEVDLCSRCMAAGTFTNDHHTLEHPFEAVRTANPLPYYADNDYASPEYLGEYSYLGF
ncbi:ZZ-type zinc finger-containing protein 3 [Apophysomyces ossiformis]|uniref:ZZ-type zinc finger-containing protein 3 n=1 Tax=Apophysomyces ossiformis TaxID=679940 RepID=A0A8H7BR22_9FUNG|nr:ZZ-type zinc finger-containing protein 3 [Apophysomyces ossiformis]